jgi:hypothetical protein
MAENVKVRMTVRAPAPDDVSAQDYVSMAGIMIGIEEIVAKYLAEWHYELVDLEFQQPWDHRERKQWHRVGA